ncbi:hypothetical protein [Microbulbifer sp. ARAS458-1]|uniref:hypothetical protein n=1 Tax=Microbulbifer sp. ARAS458-1 TaxID=3140242 RepID=UPI003877B022
MFKVALSLAVAGGGLAVIASRARAGESEQKDRVSVLEAVGLGDVMQALRSDQEERRGIRNNNPLNIERNHIQWYGMAEDQSADSRFVVFEDARYGYRAAARILNSYRARGIITLMDILQTWAPAHENNVSAYVSHISQRTGIAAAEVVEPERYPELFDAMTWHENGKNPYPLEYIREGVSWAYA